MQIQIRHSGYKDNKAKFSIVRSSDMKTAGPVYLTPPEQTIVQGSPQKNLRHDLIWYFEKFLELPLGGNILAAERTEAALQAWGTDCFHAINQGHVAGWFIKAREAGLENLTLTITSDDPGVLSWPWEALYSTDDGFLALRCRIERQLSDLGDTVPLSANLPKDRINILLVIARPFGEEDVGYFALARPIVEVTKNFPVHVDVLRPPTFDQLRQTLLDHPDHYHIVHFDGHGGYGDEQIIGSAHTFKGPQGKLAFENIQAMPEPVEAERLSQLLAEHRIPIMVLNACQSGMIDENADDAFASVAASLLRAGIRSVVAMGYSLYVSGAQQFIPAFYKQLLKTGNVTEAVRFGRQAMYDKPLRICSMGEHGLKDWLVPVVYQQTTANETILPKILMGAQQPLIIDDTASKECLEEAQTLGDYGFIGRGQAVQALERAMFQQSQGAILIHGMAGIGKTTLAKGFLQWLADTGGLPQKVFWIDFRDIHSAEHIINQLITLLFGANTHVHSLEQKIHMLANELNQNVCLMVWDNFELASGIPRNSGEGHLQEEYRTFLKQFLKKLRDSKSKILITSRSPEDWLAIQECYPLPLFGLNGEELSAYCNAIVMDLGLRIDRRDKNYRKLISKLDGNPLAIRAILLRLNEHRADRLLAELKNQFVGLAGDESTQRILETLGVFDLDFPKNFTPVLQLISLYEGCYVDKSSLDFILKMAKHTVPSEIIEDCFRFLTTAGLCHKMRQNIYSLHPVLRPHLTYKYSIDKALYRAFSDFMVLDGDALAPKEYYEQRETFSNHDTNLYHMKA